MVKKPLHNVYVVIRNGAAIILLFLVLATLSSRVVWFMAPLEGSWCRGDGYVQARFAGYKVRDLRPVRGSVTGSVRQYGFWDDVLFEFVDDPTPDSSKPKGKQHFGVWRWYGPLIAEAQMSMRHTNRPLGMADGGSNPNWYEVISTYGPYTIPTDIARCEP
ncbi:hypothetical protein KX928_23390 [Roseobacter sp. YSTF-M11]|uniref:Uncharacterized protein n=1 Tax=Roseobacter insulae TaxID=2859783 RepID=A0A9X1K0Y0_9RHOB|nr:hypothetical protein [Roseobacter insulae]MBW4710745.1 hypothetical protein [Roseobacter insulae]